MSGWLNALAIVAASVLSGVAGSWLTGRREAKTQPAQTAIAEGALELDERRADGEAYERAQQISERAQQISERIVTSLQEELHRLDQTIQGLRGDLAAALRRNSELEVENTQLAGRNAQLEGHIQDLERSAATMRDLLDQASGRAPRDQGDH